MDYFIECPDKEAVMVANAKLTRKIHGKYNDVFAGIGCFKGIISLHVIEGTKPYLALPRCLGFALQESFKKELGHLQEQQIIVPLGISEKPQLDINQASTQGSNCQQQISKTSKCMLTITNSC